MKDLISSALRRLIFIFVFIDHCYDPKIKANIPTGNMYFTEGLQYNYANEPGILKNIYEAYAGYQLYDKIWIDAGIFSSHIGAETAISFDNYTLSRSIMAENTPYYESGVKATYSHSNKLSLSFLILNGWQNIVENNENKAIGTQITVTPKENLLFNSSTFIGKEMPAYDTVNSWRYFHNFYTQFTMSRLKLLASFDIGLQQRGNTRHLHVWYNNNLIVKYDFTQKWASSLRLEYYDDKNGIIITPGTAHGFQTFAPSLNIDCKLTEVLLWRIEGRIFQSRNSVYLREDQLSRTNQFLLTSICLKLK